jgi:hypothetical protein
LSPLGPQTAAHNFLPSFSFEMMVIDSEFDLSEGIIMSATSFVVHRLERLVVVIGVLFLAAALFAIIQAQAQESKSPAEGRVIVIGEGSISVPPDYAQIRTGVTTTAKTVKEANDANIKVMTAITATLLDSEIPQKNIQTSRFSSSLFLRRKRRQPSPNSLVIASRTKSMWPFIRSLGSARSWIA